MPKFISEIRRFTGMVRDIIKRDIPKNKYYTAENINLTPNNVDSFGGATTMLGSTFAIDLGQINFANDVDDYKAWKIPLDLSSGGISHSFTITGVAPFSILAVGATPALRLANLISSLESATTTIGGDVYLQDTPISGITYIGFRAYGADRDLTESIAGTSQEIITIKEFIGVAGNGYFEPIKSIYINKNLYILSTNGVVFRLGVGQKDYTNGNWTYAVLLQTNQLTYATDAIIDLDGEIDFAERVSLYFVGTGYIPRCLYVKEQDTWVANSAMIYYDSITENTDGYYVYDTIAQETTLQILENFARVTSFTVNNSGGVLTAGDKQYFVRMFVTGDNPSGISVGSTIIPVYSDSLTDTRLKGDIGGEITTKSITLTIDGLNTKLYDSFELIRVSNTQGVFTADIVGKYDISSTTQTVLDNGTSVSSLSINELATQQIVIKDAKNLVIARNRLFISNISTQIDYDLSAWAKTIEVTTNVITIAPIGDNYSSVNEYMTPNNYTKIGYQEFETYRMGIQLYFKNGFVSSPYFVADWQPMRDDSYQSAITTDNDIDKTPNSVLVFQPLFNIDFTTATIDGVPLNELVYGYSIVRRDCIQEIWSGVLMPSQTAMDGVNFACGQNTVLAQGAYTGTGEYRKNLMFLCPDLNFGVANLTPSSGNTIYNFGSVMAYNYIYDNSQVGSGGSFYSLSEFSGKTNRTTIQTMTVEEAEIVDFNSTGNIEFLSGVKPTTLVDFGVTTAANNRYGCNQKVIAVRTTTELTDAAGGVSNPQPSWSINYALWYKPITNKYGDENSGTYRDCGHFKVLNGASTVLDTTVFGGDTFPQKTFSKFCNLAYFDYGFTINDSLTTTPATAPFPTGTYKFVLMTDYGNMGLPFIQDRVLAETITGTFVIPEPNEIKLTITQPTSSFGDGFQYKVVRVYNGTDYQIIAAGLYGFSNPTEIFDNNTEISATTAPTTINYGSKSAWAMSFYTSNRGNYQLRYFNDSDSDKNYPYQTTLIREWMANELSAGAMLYSGSYTPNTPATTYRSAFDNTLSLDTKENNVIIYSELKLTNSLTDSYRIFKPLNRKEYPAKYGSINNTFVKDMNFLVVFMDEQVLYQSLDQQQNQTNSDGSVITIGDGTVLGAREQTISNIGSPFKTMAIAYKNSRGLNHMSWYNPYLKKWMRYTGSLDDIGEECGVQSFLTENTTYCVNERTIIFGYDFINDELLMTANYAFPMTPSWGAGSTYVANDMVVYNPIELNQNQYYIANINVPMGVNPSTPSGQVQYWSKVYQSNFTLAFNDKLKVVSDFKLMKPVYYMPFNETYLTNVSSVLIKGLYEHNRGLNLYDDIEIMSSITIVFNDLADFFKTFRTIYTDISNQPFYATIKAGDYITYAENTEMGYIRPHWGINVKNDATITVDNPIGSNSIQTAQPSSQLCEVTIYFSNSSEENRTTFREIIMKMIPRPKYFNN